MMLWFDWHHDDDDDACFPLLLQIMRIVGNIRPDRQTVMFSATFPRSVETLARQVLQDPVEIQVGGRAVSCLHHAAQFALV
jgi:superfamily II DNA/RNA helicase